MPSEESIDELVDKVINKVGKNSETEFEKIEETDSFRYLKDEEEIKSVLKPVGVSPLPATVWQLPEAVKMVDGELCLAGLGDSKSIESIIQRHIQLRKIKKK
jgi:hypothetical protein